MKRIARPAAPVAAGPRPQLDIRDLELALALATAGTTAGAAALMHITQSAVSRALAQAEEKIGTRLFERSARGLTPTPAGERLIEGAGSVLAGLGDLERRVTAPAETPPRIRMVCECYTAYRWVPSAMANLRRQVPALDVELAVEHTRDPVGALARGDIDLALLTTAEMPPAREARGMFVERALFSDEVVFVVGASHPLASRKSITQDDLRSYPLVTSLTPPAEARWFLGEVFGRRRPKLTFLRFPLTEAIVDAARAGLGIAVLSEWMASGYLGSGDLTVKRLVTGPLRRPWRVAYRADVADAAERLLGNLAAARPRLRAAHGA